MVIVLARLYEGKHYYSVQSNKEFFLNLGTAPSKHLVQKYVSMTRAGGPGVAPGVLPGLTGGHISPVQLGHGKMSSQPRQYPFYRYDFYNNKTRHFC